MSWFDKWMKIKEMFPPVKYAHWYPHKQNIKFMREDYREDIKPYTIHEDGFIEYHVNGVPSAFTSKDKE